MYGQTNYEAVNMMLRNPNLWNGGVINETLQRFKKSNSYSDCDFSTLDVQEIIRSYLLTLSDTMKKEQAEKKMRLDVRSLSDFTLPEWVR